MTPTITALSLRPKLLMILVLLILLRLGAMLKLKLLSSSKAEMNMGRTKAASVLLFVSKTEIPITLFSLEKTNGLGFQTTETIRIVGTLLSPALQIKLTIIV